ncbi:MAG: hypothetical protein K1X89_06835 [Myxococcaceae bacterium]|nr:hypothetical protein [Myxococcaceae bacterium]
MVLALALVLSAAPADAPAELGDDVKLLYQVVTCQDGALPANVDAAVVKAYCVKQQERFARFREHWGARAQTFLTSLEPKDLPAELVYPFGGGDLMMALTAFPDAKVITTLSLELAGDPRRLRTLKDPKALEQSLKAIGTASASTLISNDSKSVNLSAIQQGELPGQLSMHLMGLALYDLVPTRARFFRVEPDGSLHYFSAAEIEALGTTTAAQLKSNWKPPDFSPAFANVELEFVPRANPTAPPRIFRHLGANLSNDGLKAAPGVLKHLEAKGTVAAMTKAASYLLWRDEFSAVREYLLAHARFMVSDSTGVPPRFWKAKGCTVATYGTFEKSFLGTWEVFQKELRETFAADPHPLPMRFGYPDGSAEKRSHLMTATCPR